MGDPRPLDAATAERADLLDLGAGIGRRIKSEVRQFASKHPVGIDRNARKVARAQEQGLPVYCGDFTELDPAAFPSVRVVVFDNVLEHLPSLDAVEAAFDRACDVASEVVYIRHPSFEDEDYLASIGLKQYWTDWPGTHTAKIRLDEFAAMATRREIDNVSVRGVKRAPASDDRTILPLAAPANQKKRATERGVYGLYEPELHGVKPMVTFDRPVYFAFDLFFFLTSAPPTVRYEDDPDDTLARPFVRWPDQPKRRLFRRSG
jgi:hypothetical protein